MGISRAFGATPDAPNSPSAQATPAHAVPCRSPKPGRGLPVPRVASRGATSLPPLRNSSWSRSTPSSMMAMVTPAPSASGHAASTLACASTAVPAIEVFFRCHWFGNAPL